MSPQIFFNTIRIRSKNIFFHGAVIAFYIISVITTFILGIYGFARMAGVDFNALNAMTSGDSNENAADMNSEPPLRVL